MRTAVFTVVLLGIILLSGISFAQDSELVVGKVEFPNLRWGEHKGVVEVTNNSERAKFLTIETDIQFTGTYLNPQRRAQTDYLLVPGEKLRMEPTVLIPGNFGRAVLKVRIYDVVDTLDNVLPGQLIYEQPFILTFRIPDDVAQYFQERIKLPPRVEDHPAFDNEFARILFVLLDKGKTPGTIAEMLECDTSFVTDAVRKFVVEGFLKSADYTNKPTFPIISTKEAEQGREIALDLVDFLADHITKQMPAYYAVVDSLVKIGKVPIDSNTFFNGGVVLYQPYPVVAGLAMWWRLGQYFITGTEPLDIYKGTDVCNAQIPEYMYAVQGGPALAGKSFYSYTINGNGFRILYGDTPPVLKCEGDFILKHHLRKPVHWNAVPEYVPETFMVDTTIVDPAIEVLVGGVENRLDKTKSKLEKVADGFDHEGTTKGYRYWFWDLVATRTLAKLTDAGVLTRRGNGQFRFDSMK